MICDDFGTEFIHPHEMLTNHKYYYPLGKAVRRLRPLVPARGNI